MKRILTISLLVIAALIVGLILFVQFSWKKTFDAPYPDIQASTDSSVIEHGKHLVFGPAHCGACHVPMDKLMDVENGDVIPLSGGWELTIPPGTFRAPNITPDPETGIGKLTDAELARTIRYGVKSDHTMLFPFMAFQNLSDEDLIAIISYLRAQPPVKNQVPKSEPSFLGKAIMAFGALKPEQPEKTPPKMIARTVSAEYGEYMAIAVADCYGCHTKRDLQTGAFIGEAFAGGMLFEPDAFTQGYAFISPNLTPDKETGWISSWTEEAFLARITGGRVHKTSPMPWGFYARLDSIETRAIYTYLQTLKPVSQKIEKVIYEPGEEYPKE